jgi:predicted metal-binding membrane protein
MAAAPGAAASATPAQRAFPPLAAALVLLAWAALWLWGESPYRRYLDHGSWLDAAPAAALCQGLPAGRFLVPLALFAGGWVLMIAAMMLPTIWPLLDRFDRLVRQRPDRTRLLALVVLGYIAIWAGFGAAAHFADAGLHRATRASPWLLFNGWAVGALILAMAGLFQFSRLKYRCLARCRTPAGFIVKHWHGRRPYRDALGLGLDHGLFCLGCCWAIMLLMFVVGSGNLGLMLALAAVMAAEKNARWGARLGRPLGAALLAGAALVAGLNLAA